jgi:hypothetical protein
MGKASRLFNGQAEQTLYGRVTPTQDQRAFLQAQWNDLANHLKAQLPRHGYSVSTWLQGSYKYGTLIKPVQVGEEYDVDVGVYFEWEPSATELAPTARQLRDWVQAELHAYKRENGDVKEIVEPPKERCSRAVYAKRFHIDTPTYHLNPRRDKRQLASLAGNWESSDPKAIYKWFKEVVGGAEREQLRRLIRYLKGWAAVAFTTAPESRPSSIVLTVLTAQIYKEMWLERLGGMNDEDSLIGVVKAMHQRLAEDLNVWNPVDSKEPLNRISKDAWGAFFTRLTVLRDAAEVAEAAADEAAGALAWGDAFLFLMPLPETDELEIDEAAGGTALMRIPDVEIDIADDRNFEQVLATHRNEIPGVAKGKWLRFRIMNPQIIPAMAVLEWTVRNDGRDADYIGDLGHVTGGIAAFSVIEHTAYVGKQYMDLTVRCNGTVYAARRIAVTIEDPRALVNPKARSTSREWIKLRSRRNRRR